MAALDCYAIITCQVSSEDKETNNITLVNSGETLTGPLEGVVPMHLISWWLNRDASAKPVEVQIQLIDAGGKAVTTSPAFAVTFTPGFNRFRVVGFPSATEAGQYEFRAQWREGEGEDWHETTAYWPMQFKSLPAQTQA